MENETENGWREIWKHQRRRYFNYYTNYFNYGINIRYIL